MRTFIPLILLSLIILTGCHRKKAGHSEIDRERTEADVEFKKIENLRFGFLAEIPAGWTALDASDNGDGYIFRLPGPDSGGVDIRMYGSYEEVDLSTMGKDTVEIFRFSDGQEGRALKDNNRFIVQRMLGGDRFVVFTVESTKAGWIGSHRKILMKIARSMVPVKQFGDLVIW